MRRVFAISFAGLAILTFLWQSSPLFHDNKLSGEEKQRDDQSAEVPTKKEFDDLVKLVKTLEGQVKTLTDDVKSLTTDLGTIKTVTATHTKQIDNTLWEVPVYASLPLLKPGGSTGWSKGVGVMDNDTYYFTVADAGQIKGVWYSPADPRTASAFSNMRAGAQIAGPNVVGFYFRDGAGKPMGDIPGPVRMHVVYERK